MFFCSENPFFGLPRSGIGKSKIKKNVFFNLWTRKYQCFLDPEAHWFRASSTISEKVYICLSVLLIRDKQTHRQTNAFFSYDPPTVEGTWCPMIFLSFHKTILVYLTVIRHICTTWKIKDSIILSPSCY